MFAALFQRPRASVSRFSDLEDQRQALQKLSLGLSLAAGSSSVVKQTKSQAHERCSKGRPAASKAAMTSPWGDRSPPDISKQTSRIAVANHRALAPTELSKIVDVRR